MMGYPNARSWLSLRPLTGCESPLPECVPIGCPSRISLASRSPAPWRNVFDLPLFLRTEGLGSAPITRNASVPDKSVPIEPNQVVLDVGSDVFFIRVRQCGVGEVGCVNDVAAGRLIGKRLRDGMAFDGTG